MTSKEIFERNNRLIFKYLFLDIEPIKLNPKLNPLSEVYQKPKKIDNNQHKGLTQN